MRRAKKRAAAKTGIALRAFTSGVSPIGYGIRMRLMAWMAAPPMQKGGAVTRAAFSADGARVVTASDDETARVWDAAKRPRRVLRYASLGLEAAAIWM